MITSNTAGAQAAHAHPAPAAAKKDIWASDLFNLETLDSVAAAKAQPKPSVFADGKVSMSMMKGLNPNQSATPTRANTTPQRTSCSSSIISISSISSTSSSRISNHALRAPRIQASWLLPPGLLPHPATNIVHRHH